jgi:tRNA dimethylallyltransferase
MINNIMITTHPLLVIVGETASGKSELALELAKRFDGELICADSSTVRREVNIGSTKPTAEQRASVPHHLLDVVGPNEAFTAAQFKQLAQAAIEDISNRGKLPIMVGGTGLYIDSVLYDYGFRDEADPGLRAELNKLGREELLARIKELDIEPGDVDINNPRRLIRLIETRGAKPERAELRENTFIIGLRTDREQLKDRVEKRVGAMLEQGLEAEARGLAGKYGWGCEALKAVGYAQWRQRFEGHDSAAETRQKIIRATVDLAKRQRTWFRRNNSIQWISTPVNQTEIVDLITTFLSK